MWYTDKQEDHLQRNRLSGRTGSLPDNGGTSDTSMPAPVASLKENHKSDYDFSSPGNRHIMGYTGFIPGIAYKYGTSYDKAADDSMSEFSDRQEEYRKNRSRSNSEIKFNNYENVENSPIRHKNKEFEGNQTRSSRYPPIVGYTGHISHMMNSLGHGFHESAMNALEINEKDSDDYDASVKERKMSIDLLNGHESRKFGEVDEMSKWEYEAIEREKKDALEKKRALEKEMQEEASEKEMALEIKTTQRQDIIDAQEKATNESIENYRRGIHTGRRMFY